MSQEEKSYVVDMHDVHNPLNASVVVIKDMRGELTFLEADIDGGCESQGRIVRRGRNVFRLFFGSALPSGSSVRNVLFSEH